MADKKRPNVLTTVLLCAIGMIIPIYSPMKIVIEPASFTIGSHIPIFIAMFLSPLVAIATALATTIGFYLGGFSTVIVSRAASQLVFAAIGAKVLMKNPSILNDMRKAAIFSLSIGFIHALSEVMIVTPFYLARGMIQAYYAHGYFTSVILLVGVGTWIHSILDFAVAYLIWKSLPANRISPT